jgi:RNA polymerase sigma-70 factor (ECF subfamily)
MSAGEGAGGETEAATDVAHLVREHATVMARVAMALLGDQARTERALELAAREAGGKTKPEGVSALAWLLGLVRSASSIQLSKLPLRTRTGPLEAPAPETQRLGAGDAIPAREALARLKPTEREAVVLCLVGGLEAVDVAAACNVDVATAKTRIARGLEQLLEDVMAGEGGAR